MDINVFKECYGSVCSKLSCSMQDNLYILSGVMVDNIHFRGSIDCGVVSVIDVYTKFKGNATLQDIATKLWGSDYYLCVGNNKLYVQCSRMIYCIDFNKRVVWCNTTPDNLLVVSPEISNIRGIIEAKV